MSDNWPAAVPRDYTQLYKEYGDYIAYMCQRYGRADQSPADLLQHIWEKLIKAEVLEKYVRSLQTNSTVPDTIGTLEACALLGISFGAWRSAHWSYQKIFKQVLGGVAPVGGKNRGMTKIRELPVRCSKCKGAGNVIEEKEEITCPKCQGKTTTGIRTERWVSWMPEPIPLKEDPDSTKKPKVIGPVSSKARFRTKQVIALAEMGYFRDICVNLPTPTATSGHFKNYLRQAVKNHFANWVRTKKRRHKERPADSFSQFRDPDGENFSMEDKIVDPRATDRMEAMVDIGRVLGRTNASELHANRDKLFALLDDGYDLAEAVKKLKLSAATQHAVQQVIENLA